MEKKLYITNIRKAILFKILLNLINLSQNFNDQGYLV